MLLVHNYNRISDCQPRISQALLIIKKSVIAAGDDWRKSGNVSNKKKNKSIYQMDMGKGTSNSG